MATFVERDFHLIQMGCKNASCTAYINFFLLQDGKIKLHEKLEVPVNIWTMILRKSRAGMEGDSKFVKSMALMLWDPADLRSRSVTGRTCNRLAKLPNFSSKVTGAMTPEKLKIIQGYFSRLCSFV